MSISTAATHAGFRRTALFAPDSYTGRVATIQVIDNAAGLSDLRPEWTRFANTFPATPFQTPEWLLTWWKHFGNGTPHVLVFRNGHEMAGVVPCFLHEWKGRRQLTLIGSGITDYLDPLWDPRQVAHTLEALDAHLESRAEWDVCDWQDLSADTPLQALAPTMEDTPCSRVPLEQSFEAFLAGRPKDVRHNLRRNKRRALRAGTVRASASVEADPLLVQSLIDLHGARWRRAGKPGMIEANSASAFLRDVAAALARAGMLVTFALYFKERVAAVILALRNHHTMYSYLGGFDPEYEEFGFGSELLAQALEYAHARNYRHWDFLRGNEGYKFLWGAQPVPKRRLVLERCAAAAPDASASGTSREA